MRLHGAELPGVRIVELERHEDGRGALVRTYCADAFRAAGVDVGFVQSNVVTNGRRGTLRGMHWQEEPFGEAKLVACVHGVVHDVLVDVRPDSPAFGRWMSLLLDADTPRALFVPPGIAHGYQTLTDGAVLVYQMSAPYSPAHARGVRWDDPALGIAWPIPSPILSDRDRSHPPFHRGS